MSEAPKSKTGGESTPADMPTEKPSNPQPRVSDIGSSAAAAQSSQPSKKTSGMMLVGAVILIAVAIAATVYLYKKSKDPNYSFKKELERLKQHERAAEQPDE